MKKLTRALLLTALSALGVCAAFVWAPVPAGLLDYRPVASVRVLDRQGLLLRELKSRADGRSTPLASRDIPQQVRQAFIAAEDHRFFDHHGVSLQAAVRALWQNVKAGKVVSGGSTITMQLARNLIPRERTLLGKVYEALWALRLEAHLSKEEILAQYLNRISFGNNSFGIEAASQLYFNRPAKHLSLAQAATLASIPRGPTAYNPYRAPQRLEERRRWVLSRLERLSLANRAEVEQAKTASLDLTAFTGAFRAPHFVEWVARNLDAWGLSEATVVQTSLDPKLQETVEEQIEEELYRLEERRVSSAAVVVIDNESGEVLAYQGSADFFDEAILGQNDGVQMRRQPGSALKPFIYAAAFERGVTAATVIPDVETQFGGRKGAYAPKNYDRRSHGPVRAREALANSYNVPAVRIADTLGLEVTLRVLHRAGFESLQDTAEHYGLGIALGNGEVTLWEAARAYAGLSRGGVVKPLRPVLKAFRADGTELELTEAFGPRRFVDSRAAALVTDILSDNAARARAFGLDNALRLPFPVAAKTGTSKGYSDNWTLGYTRERTVGVWAGNFDGSPMVHVSGITGAGPIFRRVMARAIGGTTPAALVSRVGLVSERICPLSGDRAGPQCPAAMDELFIDGTAPAHDCAMHAWVSEVLPSSLAGKCRDLFPARQSVTDLGPQYDAWSRAEGLSREPWLASVCRGSRPGSSGLTVVTPAQGDQFLLLDDLPLESQAIPLRISASAELGPLEIRIDGERALTLSAPFTGKVAARKGAHTLSVHRVGEEPVLAQVRYSVRTEPSL